MIQPSMKNSIDRSGHTLTRLSVMNSRIYNFILTGVYTLIHLNLFLNNPCTSP